MPKVKPMEGFFTTAEVLETLNISKTSLDRLIEVGVLHPERTKLSGGNGPRYFKKGEVEAALQYVTPQPDSKKEQAEP